MARRLWQAVTPEPQYITACSGACAPSTLGELLPQAVGRKHHSFIGHVALEEVIDGAGDVPGRAIEWLVRPLKALGCASVHQQHGRVAERGLDAIDHEAQLLAPVPR